MLEAKAFLRGTSTGIAGGFPNQMSNAEAIAFAEDYTGRLNPVPSSAAAFASHWINGSPMTNPSAGWDKCKIVFMYERLEAQGVLENYYTLQIIANHEIGHALGLADYVDEQGNPLDNGVIMHPHYNTCTADVPTAADLNGIYAIYG